jgi:urease accessory protein
LIAARGARHRAVTRIDLAPSARLVWREEIVLGRCGETPGSVATRLRVLRSGRPLLDHDLAVGPDHPGSLGPAVTGAHRALGGVLIVDPAWADTDGRDRITGVRPEDGDLGAASIAALPLTGPAVLLAAVAEDGLALGRLLDRVLGRLLPEGSPVGQPA